jgi:hypothetical protein
MDVCDGRVVVCHGEVVKSDHSIEHPYCAGSAKGCPAPQACLDTFHKSKIGDGMFDVAPLDPSQKVERPMYKIIHVEN